MTGAHTVKMISYKQKKCLQPKVNNQVMLKERKYDKMFNRSTEVQLKVMIMTQ